MVLLSLRGGLFFDAEVLLDRSDALGAWSIHLR
jgi:hypothetical protein